MYYILEFYVIRSRSFVILSHPAANTFFVLSVIIHVNSTTNSSIIGLHVERPPYSDIILAKRAATSPGAAFERESRHMAMEQGNEEHLNNERSLWNILAQIKDMYRRDTC